MSAARTQRRARIRAKAAASAASLCLLTVFGLVPHAAAEEAKPQDVVILQVAERAGAHASLQDVAAEVEAELTAQGIPHLSLEQGRVLFEERHSRPPVTLSAEEIERLDAHRVAALEAVGSGASPAEALEKLEVALSIADRALETLNRDESMARKLFGVCLLSVQVLAEMRRDADAQRRARECTVRSPGMTLPAEDRTFSAAVRTRLLDAQKENERGGGSPVTVESEPSGCSVFLNGRRVGSTPYASPALAGAPYRVQVECEGQDQPGRVHEVIPADEKGALRVDAGLEGAVRTEGGDLRLEMDASDPALPERVRAVQSVLGSSVAVVLSRPGAEVIALERFGGGGRASIQLRASHTQDEVRAALAKLLATARSARVASREEVEPSRVERGERSRPRATAIALGAGSVVAGLTLTGLGFWRYGEQRDRAATYTGTNRSDDAYLARGDSWADARTMPYVLSGIGAALSTGGSLVLATRAPSLPWWAPTLAGAVGVGLASWGIAELAQGGSCDPSSTTDTRVCANRRDQRDLGALLVLASAPALGFFTAGVAKVARGRADRATQVFLRPQNHGAVVAIRRPL